MTVNSYMNSIVTVYISIFHSDTSVYRADIVFPITLYVDRLCPGRFSEKSEEEIYKKQQNIGPTLNAGLQAKI